MHAECDRMQPERPTLEIDRRATFSGRDFKTSDEGTSLLVATEAPRAIFNQGFAVQPSIMGFRGSGPTRQPASHPLMH